MPLDQVDVDLLKGRRDAMFEHMLDVCDPVFATL